MDHERLRLILESLGWDVEVQDDSAKLTRWLCVQQPTKQRLIKSKEKTRWKKEELRSGVQRNNFAIVVT